MHLSENRARATGKSPINFTCDPYESLRGMTCIMVFDVCIVIVFDYCRSLLFKYKNQNNVLS